MPMIPVGSALTQLIALIQLGAIQHLRNALRHVLTTITLTLVVLGKYVCSFVPMAHTPMISLKLASQSALIPIKLMARTLLANVFRSARSVNLPKTTPECACIPVLILHSQMQT